MLAGLVGRGSVALLLALIIFSGCQTSAPSTGHNIRFHLEGEATGMGAIPMRLPFSGVVLNVDPSPVLTESDLVDVQWIRAGSSFQAPFDFRPEFLMRFRFIADASGALEQFSREYRGQHLILIVDGDPIGALRFEDPVDDGELLLAPELRAREVPEQVDSLRRSLHRLKRARQLD